MPFPQQRPLSFTRFTVESLHPVGSLGCYGLFRKDIWVYVGKGDIRARLLDHLNNDNPCITSQAPYTLRHGHHG